MNREDIFRYLHVRDFDSVVLQISKNYEEIATDTILQNAVSIFIDEIINSGFPLAKSETNYRFTQIYLVNYKYNFLTEAQFEKVVISIINTATTTEEKLFYAALLPNNEYCIKVIKEGKKEIPVQLEHTQEVKISVKQVETEKPNETKSIFNSQQERTFFFALRNCFPNHFIYPNIGISTIVNRKIAEAAVQPNELSYYFNASIDFVIIDQFNDFKPICGIELDSEWHRLHNQDKKDAIKNKILKAAGLPTYRIEHFSKFKTVEEFEKVIIEVVKLR